MSNATGGSAVASDSIHREVLRVREAGKPIVVSMGNLAASGGYYVSAPASKIVANPATITGSIGVAFGKFNFDGLLREIGVDAESVSLGKNATAMLPITGFTEEQERMADRLTDHVYEGFLQKVAAGRKLGMEEVKKIAKGRIWTGEEAAKLGLVDQLGGLQDAISLAKKDAGLPTEDESSVEIKEFPKQRPPFVRLLQMLRGSGPDASFLVGGGSPPHALQLLAMTVALSAFSEALQAGDIETAALSALPGLGGMRMQGPQLTAPALASYILA